MSIQPFNPKTEFPLANELLEAVAQQKSLPPTVSGSGVESVLKPVIAQMSYHSRRTTHGIQEVLAWLKGHRQTLERLTDQPQEAKTALRLLEPFEEKLRAGFKMWCSKAPKPTNSTKPPTGALLLLFALSSYCGGSLIEKPFAEG